MKILGVELKIIKGNASNIRMGAALQDDFLKQEKFLRESYARILKKACVKKIKSVVLSDLSVAFAGFPKLATAKIIAQEIYRCVKEEKHCLKNIIIVLSTDKDRSFFENVITAYLTHIVEKLCQGPFVTVDMIIEVKGGIVLIERSNPPFGWALPGGFLDYGESLEEGAVREAKEETGLTVKGIQQMHTYSKPGRDPRFQTVTTVFVGKAKGKPTAGSDAQGIRIVNPKDLKNIALAFDHSLVLKDYLRWKKLGS